MRAKPQDQIIQPAYSLRGNSKIIFYLKKLTYFQFCIIQNISRIKNACLCFALLITGILLLNEGQPEVLAFALILTFLCLIELVIKRKNPEWLPRFESMLAVLIFSSFIELYLFPNFRTSFEKCSSKTVVHMIYFLYFIELFDIRTLDESLYKVISQSIIVLHLLIRLSLSNGFSYQQLFGVALLTLKFVEKNVINKKRKEEGATNEEKIDKIREKKKYYKFLLKVNEFKESAFVVDPEMLFKSEVRESKRRHSIGRTNNFGDQGVIYPLKSLSGTFEPRFKMNEDEEILYFLRNTKVEQNVSLNDNDDNPPDNNIIDLNETLLEYMARSYNLNGKSNETRNSLLLGKGTPGSSGFLKKQLLYIKNDLKKLKGEFFDPIMKKKLKYNIRVIYFYFQSKLRILVRLTDNSIQSENMELREFDKFKDRLLALVAHDMRSPLNTIVTMITRAKSATALDLKEESMVLCKINAELLLNLVSDLLDYSLFKENKLSLNFEEFSLQNTLFESLSLIKLQAEHKNLYLNTINSYERDILFTDQRRLKQVLINLLTNSLKFTKKGMISVRIIDYNGVLRIDIIDTGGGIKPENIRKLCLPFETFDNIEKVNRQGIGLGLFITKTIVSQIGPFNNLFIESIESKGSRFSFFIYSDMRNVNSGINYTYLKDSFPKLADELIYDDLVQDSSLKSSFASDLSRRNRVFEHKFNHLEDLTKLNPFFRGRNRKAVPDAKSPHGIEDLSSISFPDSSDEDFKKSIYNRQLSEIQEKSLHRMQRFESCLILESSRGKSSGIMTELCILIADDNVFNLLAIESILRSIKDRKVIICKASDGSEALEIFKSRNEVKIAQSTNTYLQTSHPIDIIFMDCMMPMLDGYSATREIKKLLLCGCNFVKCLIYGLTALRLDEAEKSKCLEAGMAGVLEKPLNEEKIWEILNNFKKQQS